MKSPNIDKQVTGGFGRGARIGLRAEGRKHAKQYAHRRHRAAVRQALYRGDWYFLPSPGATRRDAT